MTVIAIHRKIFKDNQRRASKGMPSLPHYARPEWILPGETKAQARARRFGKASK